MMRRMLKKEGTRFVSYEITGRVRDENGVLCADNLVPTGLSAEEGDWEAFGVLNREARCLFVDCYTWTTRWTFRDANGEYTIEETEEQWQQRVLHKFIIPKLDEPRCCYCESEFVPMVMEMNKVAAENGYWPRPNSEF